MPPGILDRAGAVRSVLEYLEKAAEFDKLAEQADSPASARRFADLAACYRLLASERKRLIKDAPEGTGAPADQSPPETCGGAPDAGEGYGDRMNRDIQLVHLQEAERHVAEGARHIVEQEQRIAELDRDGHDTVQARKLLETFRSVQLEHVAHRDHILRELEQ